VDLEFIKLITMKNLLFISFFLFIYILSLNAQAPKDNLMLFYPFNNTALDESGNGNNGILHGVTIDSDRFYIENRAYNFNGTTDYIEIPNTPALKSDFPFTVSVWINYNEEADVPIYFFRSDNFGSTYSGFWIGLKPSGQLITGYGDGNGTGAENRFSHYSNTIIEPNLWHNIIVSFNSLEDIDIYIDCRYDEGYSSGNGKSLKDSGHSGYLGTGLGSYFHGKIDDVRLYNRSINYSDVPYLCYENPYYIDSIAVTDTLIIDVTFTGLDDQSKINTIKVYPNPAKDILYINAGNYYSNIANYSIKIINSVGQTIYKSFLNHQISSVKFDDFKKRGLYFVQIIDNNNQIVDIRKIVLE